MKNCLLLAAAIAAPAAAQTVAAQTNAAPNASFDVAAAKQRINAELDKDYPHLDALYKDIHQHPEVGFQEVRTAALLAGEMRKIGFQVTEHVGKTGIVAIYRNGPGPTVMIRTELDALPLEEKTGLPYASHAQQTVDGKLSYVDHACGHDSHMAWWVGTAEALLATKDLWHGTLMFIGQPAEETIGGAKAMIADGLFTRFPKPDYGFAAHVGPTAYGTVAIKDGAVTSASDTVDITFNGRGAHGSMPDKSIDPIVMGARFVTDVQAVISRRKDPQQFGVVTVGAFNAGTVDNIIPDQAVLQLTLRSYAPDIRKLLLDGVSETAKASAMMSDAPPPTIVWKAGTASVRNDSQLVARVAPVLAAAMGDAAQVIPATMPGWTASEDYSAFIDAGIPSVFYAVGGDDPRMLADDKAQGKPVPVNHSPFFAPVPEPTIRTGVMTLALSVLTVAGK
ncbi:amidohydrolase [Sphingomonas abietis]|uniref:Amidohydrolase n=1 Tax=Sphingomonas abietis TaxID=3012344 RepID=A0ABY7NNX0_9SPHN|nr:amidohydrolase [Sphingomonas abietis]WBO23229.1 amidohydrolase [Sphingomonas abietis]